MSFINLGMITLNWAWPENLRWWWW